MILSNYNYNIASGVRKIKTRTALVLSAVTLAMSGGTGLSLMIFGTAHASPTPVAVYDALASVTPTTNYPSQPFQAQQTSEFGDYVHLSAGSARQLDSINLTMSNWAKEGTAANEAWCLANTVSCDSTGYTWPITVNLYANTLDTHDVPTTSLGSKTVNVHVPWRPASDSSCTLTSNGTGWLENGHCVNFSGIAFNANFNLASLNLSLPNDVIVGFAYNTQSYGNNPTSVDGPYNSLNIAVPENNPVTVGSDDSTGSVFWNTSTQDYYSNGNCVAGTFCKDTSWSPNGTVAMQINVTPTVNSPTNKDLCKKDGWMNYTDANGTTFKNQGDCVSFVATNGKL
jgi:hypothetical protein